MKVIPPLEITSSSLVSSTASEPTAAASWVSGNNYTTGQRVSRSTTNNVYRCIKDTNAQTNAILPEVSINTSDPSWISEGPPTWTSGVTYSVGQQVTRTTTNKIYQCLVANGAVNTTPPENLLTGSPIYWLELGPSNKYAMFDLLRNSSTKATNTNGTSIVVAFTPSSRVDSLALVGMKRVTSVTVTVAPSSMAAVIYSKVVTLTERETTTWYQYFFNKITTKSSLVLFDLPVISTPYITVTMSGTSIECGGLAVGMQEYIGIVQRGATNDVINFSRVDRDVFGNATLVQRRNVPKTTQTLLLEASYLDRVRKLRDSLNGTTAVWVGLDDIQNQFYFESLLIVGFYRNFSINIDNPALVVINLELEEV